jgi:hypothetical protein
MAKSNVLYLMITAVFTAAYVIVLINPKDWFAGYLCLAGTILFVWRIIRGDD